MVVSCRQGGRCFAETLCHTPTNPAREGKIQGEGLPPPTPSSPATPPPLSHSHPPSRTQSQSCLSPCGRGSSPAIPERAPAPSAPSAHPDPSIALRPSSAPEAPDSTTAIHSTSPPGLRPARRSDFSSQLHRPPS